MKLSHCEIIQTFICGRFSRTFATISRAIRAGSGNVTGEMILRSGTAGMSQSSADRAESLTRMPELQEL